MTVQTAANDTFEIIGFNGVYFNAPIGGSGATLVKTGASNIFFNAANAYSGATVVNQGGVIINGATGSINSNTLIGFTPLALLNPGSAASVPAIRRRS